MSTLCIDPRTGMAGDMFSAALIGLGAPTAAVVGAMERAGRLLGGAGIRMENVEQDGVHGVRLHVNLAGDRSYLSESEARRLLEKAVARERLAPPFAEFARRVLDELLAAEREAHAGGEAYAGGFRVIPVGVARTPYAESAPFQPDARADGEFRIEVFARFAAGLDGIESFSHIIVISYLDRSPGWSLTVTPPWQRRGGPPRRVGLFASRSPNRPTPLGLTIAELRGVEGNVLKTGPLDLFDGTPVVDIKPYIRSLDGGAVGNDGWLSGTDHLELHKKGVPHRHHGEEAVLHEAADILVDIMGAACGLEALGIVPDGAICMAPVAVGGGTVRSSHGLLPVPPPAVQAILRRRRIPHVSGPVDVELLTPTGAALLAALRPRFVPRELAPPAISGSGRGFGLRQLPQPNALTLYLA